MKSSKAKFRSSLYRLIPVGLVALIVVLTVVLIQVALTVRSRADVSEGPRNILVSNVTPNSFTVTFVTDKQTTGSLIYGKTESPELIALDSLGTAAVYNHLISVRNLNPETTYNFLIKTNNTVSARDSRPFKVTLPPVDIVAPPTPKIVTGSVVRSGIKVVDYTDSIVLLQVYNQFLSVRPDNTGNFLFTLTNFVDSQGHYSLGDLPVGKVISFVNNLGYPSFVLDLQNGKTIVPSELPVAPRSDNDLVPQSQVTSTTEDSSLGMTAQPVTPSLWDNLVQLFNRLSGSDY